jgi:predicted RNase H-like nuclease (RuvC/YqgF family)
MSSALDGRIRALARKEAEEIVRSAGASTTTSIDVQGLQQQITDLHEHLHHTATVIKRLEDRIDALEKAAGPTGDEQRPAARRTRRTPSESRHLPG